MMFIVIKLVTEIVPPCFDTQDLVLLQFSEGWIELFSFYSTEFCWIEF
jgi:hypothetical protein